MTLCSRRKERAGDNVYPKQQQGAEKDPPEGGFCQHLPDPLTKNHAQKGWHHGRCGQQTVLLAQKGRIPEQELLALPSGFVVKSVR